MTSPTPDPRQQGTQPPFAQPEQPYPGKEEEMRPRADHGESSYRGTGSLAGRAALITGADSGIGRAVALAFAREGADVCCSYLSEEQDAQRTTELVEQAGRRALPIAGDIGQEDHCRELVSHCYETFGRLDILVNNAAYQQSLASLDDYTEAQIDRTFRTNIYAMFFLARAAVPHMPAGGSIINTTSIQAYQPSPNLLDYASTKCAIIGFTKGLAKLVIAQGIRVNAVAPGPVWTPLIPATMPHSKVEHFGDNTLLDRPAQPAELAPVYVLLASPASSYITGEVFGVTGGRMPY